jgi:hypothetical protein
VTSLDGVISTRVRLGGRVIFQSSAGGDALANFRDIGPRVSLHCFQVGVEDCRW